MLRSKKEIIRETRVMKERDGSEIRDGERTAALDGAEAIVSKPS